MIRHSFGFNTRGIALAMLAVTLSLGCGDHPVAPPEHRPYLAILSAFTSSPGVATTGRIRYTVEELSGTLGIQRTIAAARTDTLILALPPASYVVELLDLPPTCSVREGPKKFITLLETDDTGLLRYTVSCIPSLTIQVLMDGQELDSQLVYRLSGAGEERVGFVDLSGPDSNNARGDTIRFDGLPAGNYHVSLSQVADNCIFTGLGPRERSVSLPASGGETVTFRLRCSKASERPRILSLASTYHDSVSAFVLRVADPDRDVAAYTWDLTDCRGNSVLADNAGRTRRGLDVGRTQRADTLVIVGAFEAGIADSLLRNACTALRVDDQRGNTSAIVEQRIVAYRGGSAPSPVEFNATLRGTQGIVTRLAASDADGDFVGTFAALRVRDGILGPFDGQPDIGILSAAGYLGTLIPEVALGDRIRWDDAYAMIVYLIDGAGNFRRLEDKELSR